LSCRPYSADAARRALAVLLGVFGIALAARYCLSAGCATPSVFAIAGIVCATSSLWCWALPVVLVAGDLYPWTGSLLVSERDLFLTSALVVLLWHTTLNGSSLSKHRRMWILWLPLAVSVGVSVFRGWHFLQPSIFGDDLSLYGSQWNAVRVAKGFAWGIVLAPFLTAEIGRNVNAFRLFTAGVQTSAFFVAMAVIYERAISVGLFDLHQLYRASGPFFSMHTGGQHIDAFWALALPFLFLPPVRSQSRFGWPIRFVILLTAYYAIAATMSRAIIVWAALAAFILVVLNLVLRASKITVRQTAIFTVLAVVMLCACAFAIFQIEPIRARFIQSRDDLLSRWQQWSAITSAAGHGWAPVIFGNGMGTVPTIASVAFGHPLRTAELTLLKNDDVALRIRPGKKVYVEQLVNAQAPGPWTLRGSLRRVGPTRLHAYVCEKTLFDSMRCVESSFAYRGQGDAWQQFTWSIDLSTLPSAAQGSWLTCPMTIAFSASGESGAVDLRHLRLTDAMGNDLLENTSFHSKSARWFFTSDDHSSWRAENLWLHLYLEQGALGVVSFAWLVLGTISLLVRQLTITRDASPGVFLMAITGFLAIGTFGSLLDTPWIVQLLCALLAVALARAAGPSRLQANQQQPHWKP
jgi:hypothetical protein